MELIMAIFAVAVVFVIGFLVGAKHESKKK